MALLKVITLPDDRLKKIAIQASSVDDRLRKIMDDMAETMKHEDGIGLASIQVGIPEAIIVIDLHHEPHDGCNHSHMEDEVPYPFFMVNPTIVSVSPDMEIDDEGCLSLPGIYVPVERAKKVQVKYLDYHGKEKELETDTFLARVVQHEMDHLKGITMLDHISHLKRQLAIKKLLKLKNSKK